MTSAAVITCSNRSAVGERPDDSGDLLRVLLEDAGAVVVHREIVPDEIDAIQRAVGAAIASGANVVLTTGGTGLTPTDVTPEAVRPLLDREVPGIAEALRLTSRHGVPTSVLSRGVAGTIGRALIVTLPGSPGGVRAGMEVLGPVLDHEVEQIDGGDHQSGAGVARTGCASSRSRRSGWMSRLMSALWRVPAL